jgi:diguanylate cyclase (GGDEF)-like protein/PAS domain S-box-containing protein
VDRSQPRADGSDAWFRELAERTGDIFFVVRIAPDLAVEFVSDTISTWGGVGVTDFLADPALIQRLIHPDDRGKLTALISGEPDQDIEFELRWRHRDGRPVWTQSRVRRRVRADDSIALEGTLHDITAVRQAERELARSEERLRLVLDNVGDAVLHFDGNGILLWASPSLQTVFGWNPDDVVGTRFWLSTAEDRREVLAAVEDAVRAGRHELRHRSRSVRGDGRIVWVDTTVRLLWAASGSLDSVVCSARDVTGQVETEQELAASQERFRLVAEESSDFTLRTVGDFVVDWISPSVTRILGWRPDEVVGHSGFDFFHPSDVGQAAEVAARGAAGETVSGRARLLCADGSYRWLSQISTPILDADGTLVARISGFQDVDAEVRAQLALAQSERRFRLAMESAPTGMAVVDLDLRFLEVNPTLCRMLGLAEAELLTLRVADVLPSEDGRLADQLRAAVQSGQSASAGHEKRVFSAREGQMWVEHSVGLLLDEDGTPLSYVCQFVDVTAARRAQQGLQFLASHDVLTSVANRHELLARIERALGRPAPAGTSLALLFIDFDEFKAINDTFGHAAGDAVLVEVSHRICGHVRADDLVARIGGDEFTVALPAVRGLPGAQAVAATIHRALADPVTVDGNEIAVTVSIGIALAEPGDTADRVLQRADRALYRAKRTGRNRTVSFDPELDG